MIDDLKLSAQLSGKLVAFDLRTHDKNIVDIDSKEKMPLLGDKDVKIKLAGCETEIEDRVVEGKEPNAGCLPEVMLNSEDPFDTNDLPARWEPDEAPGRVLLDAFDFLLHGSDLLILVRSADCVLIPGFLVGGFENSRPDGGVDNFGRVLDNNDIVQWLWSVG